ncbi:cobyrinic acid a,c-diamide synthase [Thermotomaculum hydrothermale]|uniref:Cobyrinic acid a,c-diamide synthase n=1 Tax=Thermotomaculum hydrothermale TaxID=981385 RepID=A0A7R6SYK7_9BACT|nr:ATP-binding protein [Thermotomaculum hydrothermale]BBB31832.1 cobyrinic acid a,c-diamide synthase [Thermotomaculum hydrothermale]
MKIAIASGKGGTGKSFVATNLSYALSENFQVALVDCDVEEPNAYLFLKPEIKEKRDITIKVPVIDNSKCTGCRLCSTHCEFHALITVKDKTYVFEELCHGCGFCMRICPNGAIGEKNKVIGEFSYGFVGRMDFYMGEMKVGTELATPVIRYVKEQVKDRGIVIFDSPPGTSCPVVETIEDCDFVVLVTEPSPFGLNDLKLAVETVKSMGIRFGVVENRAMEGVNIIKDYLRENNIPLLSEIPLDREIAEVYSHGKLVVREIPSYRDRFLKIYDEIVKRVEI